MGRSPLQLPGHVLRDGDLPGALRLRVLEPRLKIERDPGAAGQFGRITALDDLPPDEVIVGCVLEARRLADGGVRLAPIRQPRKALPVPKPLTAALKRTPRALAKFAAFSPSQRRDYAEWIGEAKTDATRDRRIATAVGWIAEGKSRNWKYERPR